MDGHNSHYGLELLRQSILNNVVILGYPPHCTHILQGLDVMCFGPLKQAFHDDIRKFERQHNRGVRKSDFAGVFGGAFKRVFTADLIKKAFKVTGVFPFNPGAISQAQLAPSQDQALTSTFPQLHTSPVRAVIAAFQHQPPTAFDCDPENLDPQVDPQLYTPSKRRRTLVAALASTSSGSFLVTSKPITSVKSIPKPVLEKPFPLPEPDWSYSRIQPCQLENMTRSQLVAKLNSTAANLDLARQQIISRDAVIAGTQAQLCVQHLHLLKTNAALHCKELDELEGTEKNVRVIPDHHGQVLNSNEFIQKVEECVLRKRKKDEDKHRKKESREKQKRQKLELDANWKKTITKYEQEKKKWQEEVDALKAKGVRVKDLPRQPKRPLKSSLVTTSQTGSSSSQKHCNDNDDVVSIDSIDGDNTDNDILDL
jgi:hypothetical protein